MVVGALKASKKLDYDATSLKSEACLGTTLAVRNNPNKFNSSWFNFENRVMQEALQTWAFNFYSPITDHLSTVRINDKMLGSNTSLLTLWDTYPWIFRVLL